MLFKHAAIIIFRGRLNIDLIWNVVKKLEVLREPGSFAKDRSCLQLTSHRQGVPVNPVSIDKNNTGSSRRVPPVESQIFVQKENSPSRIGGVDLVGRRLPWQKL